MIDKIKHYLAGLALKYLPIELSKTDLVKINSSPLKVETVVGQITIGKSDYIICSWVKREVAKKIAETLVREDLIEFSDSDDPYLDAVHIRGVLRVVRSENNCNT